LERHVLIDMVEGNAAAELRQWTVQIETLGQRGCKRGPLFRSVLLLTGSERLRQGRPKRCRRLRRR
jgi:hypothetical protein